MENFLRVIPSSLFSLEPLKLSTWSRHLWIAVWLQHLFLPLPTPPPTASRLLFLCSRTPSSFAKSGIKFMFSYSASGNTYWHKLSVK